MNSSGMYPKIELLGETLAPLEEVAEELDAADLHDEEDQHTRETIPSPPIDFKEFQKSEEYRDFWTTPKVR